MTFFLVAIVVSFVDPINVALYALAGFLGKTYRDAVAYGCGAGIALVGLSTALGSSAGRVPNQGRLLAQFMAAVLGALMVRAIINVFVSKRGPTKTGTGIDA